MKRMIFIILLSLQIANAIGQEFTPFSLINTTWTADLQTQGFSGPPYPPPISHNYKYYKTSGDTIINGKKYTVIDKSDFSNYCFIRQETSKVYCKYSENTYNDTSEFILYDFSFELGDTVQLPRVGNPIHYYESIVMSVDSVLVGNNFHKKFGIESWIQFDFIEGIGSLQGLFYNEIPFVDYWADLTCFSRNDTIFSLYGNGNFSNGNCWQTLDILEIEYDILSVYPNPTYRDLYITGKSIKKVILYNLNGQKIIESDFPQLHLQEIDNGVYLLKVIDFNDRQLNFKIVKNNVP